MFYVMKWSFYNDTLNVGSCNDKASRIKRSGSIIKLRGVNTLKLFKVIVNQIIDLKLYSLILLCHYMFSQYSFGALRAPFYPPPPKKKKAWI